MFVVSCRYCLFTPGESDNEKGTVKSRAGVAEWYTAPCLLHAARTVVGSSPEPPSVLSVSAWSEK